MITGGKDERYILEQHGVAQRSTSLKDDVRHRGRDERLEVEQQRGDGED